MAKSERSTVTIHHWWPDGERVTVHVEAASSYPDALSQASAEALRDYRETLGVTEATCRRFEEIDELPAFDVEEP